MKPKVKSFAFFAVWFGLGICSACTISLNLTGFEIFFRSSE
jgi:hypothetical protein